MYFRNTSTFIRQARHSVVVAFFLILCLSTFTLAQNYSFSGTISREVLDNYLERSITMQGQSEVEGVNMITETQRQENIAMLDDIGAKFVGRIGGWWENGWGQTKHDQFFAKVQQNVSDIHANDPQVICQAAVFEYVSGTVGTFQVPAYVFQAFGLPVQSRTFVYADMLYPAPASQYTVYGGQMSESMRTNTPDITRQETQLWFYYMATRYISVGCEAIHFGQVEIMNRRDIGNKAWWSVLQKIRAYASTRNRGVVVCDGHTPSGGVYYEPTLSMSQSSWQTYLPAHASNKQLLLDFHSIWVNFKEKFPCPGSYYPVTVNPDPNAGLHRRSLGGISPQGWMCRRNPYLVELDNGGVSAAVGCGYNQSQDWWLWGWDEISWFASNPEWYRNDILKYAYYKIKCMDPNGHLEMPGMRGVTTGSSIPNYNYRANTGDGNQQVTIKNLWNGVVYASPQTWVHQNFSDWQVSNAPNPASAKSNLIFVGNNRMYYIGTDNRIHGYIKYNGTWLTTSPSYAAGNVSGQQPAAGDLVANPAGTWLYYRGTDGFIYRFQIVDDWTYVYSAFPGNTAMNSQNIRAVGNILCPSETRIYYVAKEISNGNAQRVHAFILYGGSWVTTSPFWASGGNTSQSQAATGGLAMNPAKTWLYYRGYDGFIYRFQIVNDWNYTFSAFPGNGAMSSQNIRAAGNIICPSESRIYYVAKELSNGNSMRIHGFILYGSSWFTTSPTHAAGSVSTQAQASALSLSISPNQQTLAYIGTDNQMHGFKVLSDWSYQYFAFKPGSSGQNPSTYSVFNAENKLFYISTYGDQKVHQYAFGGDHCANAYVLAIEPGCCNFSMKTAPESAHYLTDNSISQTQASPTESEAGLEKSAVFPNPAQNQFTIRASDPNAHIVMITMDGRTVSSFEMAGENELTIPTYDIPNGIYFIKISGKVGNEIIKLVISK